MLQVHQEQRPTPPSPPWTSCSPNRECCLHPIPITRLPMSMQKKEKKKKRKKESTYKYTGRPHLVQHVPFGDPAQDGGVQAVPVVGHHTMQALNQLRVVQKTRSHLLGLTRRQPPQCIQPCAVCVRTLQRVQDMPMHDHRVVGVAHPINHRASNKPKVRLDVCDACYVSDECEGVRGGRSLVM